MGTVSLDLHSGSVMNRYTFITPILMDCWIYIPALMADPGNPINL
jgi:hypothetical protein